MNHYKMVDYYNAAEIANKASLNGLCSIYPELYYYVIDLIDQGFEVTGESIKTIYEEDQF